MTTEQFRRHQYLPGQWARELRQNGILQAVLEVLEDCHPTRQPVSTDLNDDLSPTKAALFLGQTRGYSQVLNTIKILAQPLRDPQQPGQPTYAPPLREEQLGEVQLQ